MYCVVYSLHFISDFPGTCAVPPPSQYAFPYRRVVVVVVTHKTHYKPQLCAGCILNLILYNTASSMYFRSAQRLFNL